MPLPEKRVCNRCRDPKPIGEFYPRAKNVTPEKLSDLSSICTKCNTDRIRQANRRKRLMRMRSEVLLDEVRKAHEWLDDLTAEQMRRGVEGVEVCYTITGGGESDADCKSWRGPLENPAAAAAPEKAPGDLR